MALLSSLDVMNILKLLLSSTLKVTVIAVGDSPSSTPVPCAAAVPLTFPQGLLSRTSSPTPRQLGPSGLGGGSEQASSEELVRGHEVTSGVVGTAAESMSTSYSSSPTTAVMLPSFPSTTMEPPGVMKVACSLLKGLVNTGDVEGDLTSILKLQVEVLTEARVTASYWRRALMSMRRRRRRSRRLSVEIDEVRSVDM